MKTTLDLSLSPALSLSLRIAIESGKSQRQMILNLYFPLYCFSVVFVMRKFNIETKDEKLYFRSFLSLHFGISSGSTVGRAPLPPLRARCSGFARRLCGLFQHSHRLLVRVECNI